MGKNVGLIFLGWVGDFSFFLFFKERSCFKSTLLRSMFKWPLPFKIIVSNARETLAWSFQSVAIVKKIPISPQVFFGGRGGGINIWWTLFWPFCSPS